jgi:hypothetical protein
VDTYTAIETLEMDETATEEEELRAIQALVNAGTWGLQGSYGRVMMDRIEAGVVALGPEPARDYYGNRIPSRFEVEAGTKGSVEFVEENSPYGRVLEGDADAAAERARKRMLAGEDWTPPGTHPEDWREGEEA